MRILFLFLSASFLLSCSQGNKPQLETSLNENATPSGAQGLKALNDFVITSFIDTKNKTTSTLYGNQVALDYLNGTYENSYPRGTELTLLTWKQTQDPRWFGGNIPDSLLSMEVVNITDSAHYSFYRGKELTPATNPGAEQATRRILTLRKMQMPE